MAYQIHLEHAFTLFGGNHNVWSNCKTGLHCSFQMQNTYQLQSKGDSEVIIIRCIHPGAGRCAQLLFAAIFATTTFGF
jgi:hypothetical protein